MSVPSFRIERATPASRIATLVLIAVALALLAGPLWLDRNGLRLVAEFAVYAALASLWNLLAGYGGLVSIGQQAYVGLGGYVLFAVALAGLPPLAAVPLAGLAAAVLALPCGALLFRLKGAYFAIGTWVVAEVFRLVAAQIQAFGGGSGMSLPIAVVRSVGQTREMRDAVIYGATLAVALGIIVGIVLVVRSRAGLALQAIRDAETAAETCGVDVLSTKRMLYVAAAAGAAMIGALIFLAKLRISPDAAFSVNDWTAYVIFITVIGGIGRLEGPIIGTLVFFALRETLADLGPVYLMVLGAAAVVVMLVAPRGLYGLLADRLGLDLFPVRRRVVATDRNPS